MAGRSPPALPEAFDRTLDVLAAQSAPYALIGGFAVAYHGIPRSTRDIDLLLSVPRIALASFLQKFLDRGFTFSLEIVLRELGEDHLSKIHVRGVRVDLLDAVIPPFRRAVEGAEEAVIHGRRVRIARAQDLIVLKMIAGREDDLRDVRGILASQGSRLDLDALRGSLRDCCEEAQIEAFERLLLASSG
jgi:predicted nucleotidyltransferase